MPIGTQKYYWAILGVDRNAKPDQIHKAYKPAHSKGCDKSRCDARQHEM